MNQQPTWGWPTDRLPRVLVVDDQAINIRVAFEALRGDHEVFMATSGEQGLQVFRDARPDLVLLDVVMPGMDGHEVCSQIKAGPDGADVPVIFITGHDSDQAQVQGLGHGAVDFIAKPFHPEVLRARVRNHLLLKFQTDYLRSAALYDGLTGLANRRHFEEVFAGRWRAAERNAQPCAVLMIDVDHFKQYNDCYGHQAGDECLRQVAGAIGKALMRPMDLAARYGGEEFVCLLPETSLPSAGPVAERLLCNVRELAVPHAASGAAPVVTVSVGIATSLGGSGRVPQDLLADADAQLYRAKAAGRNRACAASA